MAGRPKGSTQRYAKDRLLRVIRDQLGDDTFNPILEMARIGIDPNEPTPVRLNALAQVSTYIQPKLKAQETTIIDERSPGLDASKTEVAARLLSILEAARRETVPVGEKDEDSHVSH